jgi:hypothetical protein
MRRLLQIAFAGWLGLSMSLAQAWAFPGGSSSYTPASGSSADPSGYARDDMRSEALTSYLKSHRLPLVGAQVLNDAASGRHLVVLYGFVATNFGKTDATAKARAFLQDPSAIVENRVMVDPDIAASSHRHEYTSGAGSSPPPDSSAPGSSATAPDSSATANAGSGSADGADSYLEHQTQQSQIQQYENQQNPMASGGMAAGGPFAGMGGSGMAPLIALLGLLSATNGGSSMSFSSSGPFGMPNSFGASPYQRNPYGSGSPYSYPYPSSPYGSPYGSPPGSFSPYP